MNDLTFLDSPGHPHSEALHVVERYTRVNHDALEVSMTFDDPEIYAKPLVTNKLTFRLMPNDEIGEWVACEDRIRLNMETDVCKITGGWEFEAYCNRRKKGEQADTSQPAKTSPGGY